MSVFDQPFMKQQSCFGFDSNPTTSNNWMKHQSHQRVTTNEDKRREEEVETLLSEAFNGLTFKEREKQQEALHGVDKGIIEETDLIENSLIELDNYLLHIKVGSVYETAERMDKSFAENRAFRTMFLRANHYDTKAAAYHMLKFFEWKQRLFGTEKLTKEITIEDLDEDDIASIKTGWMQLAGTDSSGRTVFLQPLGLRAFKTLENELRGKYFMLMNLLKSEKAQLKGIVDLNYAVDDYKDSVHGAGFFEHIDMTIALPLHVASVHYCYNDISEYVILNLGIRAMPAKLRARFRAHFGSHLECQYLLSTFGIAGDNLPLIPGTNRFNMKHHVKWCSTYLAGSKFNAMPSMNDPTSVEWKNVGPITDAHTNDVLFIGGNKSNNGGNHHLRNLIVEWSQTYDSATTNEEKRFVVDGIIMEIRESGGRFLSQVEHGQSMWVPLTVEEVRTKITQAFRNNRRKVRGCRRKRN